MIMNDFDMMCYQHMYKEYNDECFDMMLLCTCVYEYDDEWF